MRTRRSRRRGSLIGLVAFWMVIGLLILVALALLGARLFLFPQGRYHVPTRPMTLTSADDVALSTRFLEGESDALVIVVHGAFASKRTPEIIRLAEELSVEFDVLVLDLHGHGESQGVYRFGFDRAAQDVQAALSWGREQGYRRIGVVGFSLGAASVILEQARGHQADSIVSVGCPATEQVDSVINSWAWSWWGRRFFALMGTRVNSPAGTDTWPASVVDQIAPVPLLVVHGEKDNLVPEAVSQALYEAAHEPKAYLALPDQGHARLGPARSEVRAWLRETLLMQELEPLPWVQVLERRLAQGPSQPPPDDRGTLAGRVYIRGGDPLPGALVLVSTELGHTFTTYTGDDGKFLLEAPPGRYVPIAWAPDHEAALFRHGADRRTPVEIASGETTGEIDLTLLAHRTELPDPDYVSLTLALPERVNTPHPQPVEAQRRQVVFHYAGRRVDSCFLYEPLSTAAPLPAILAVYPSEAPRWQLVSVPMAAEGYVVLACGPPYVEDLEQLDLPGQAQDLAVAQQLLQAGRLSERADTGGYGILTGSISSFILALALPDLPSPRVIAGVGAGYDLFLVLRDLYERPDYTLDEHLVLGLAALGRPDLYPETFLDMSLRYQASDLPPMAIFHNIQDEMLLIDQAEAMTATLEALGQPYELYRYPELTHYPGVEDPSPEAIQMYRDIMAVWRAYLRE